MNRNPSTLVVHAAQHPSLDTGATTPSIHLATTFARQPDGSLPSSHLYSRISNPNRDQLEEALRLLEDGACAAAFASGCAAITAVFQALRPGDLVVCAADCYSGTREILSDLMPHWGLRVSFVDLWNESEWESSIPSTTRLVWCETPSNPLLRITDISRLSKFVHARGSLLACDGTFATPLVQKPLSLGADLVVHATTKYLSGHGDMVGGAVVAGESAKALFERIRKIQVHAGAVPSPFDAWLTLRGIRTLALRMKAHCANAMELARRLEGHPKVSIVHYPGLASHPGHELAKRQMNGSFGGMLAFQVRGGEEAAANVAGNCQLILRATSLGGLETLIEHRARIEGPLSPTPRDLLRLSAGIEDVDDLWQDLERALGRPAAG
jgi:cystathionine gamma-synthase